jgi:hypothetical protein
MLPRSRSSVAIAVAFALSTLFLAACKKREMPSDFVGSYARSGDTPANLRAELSVARGGMVLTVVRLSASMDMGVFTTLFKGAGAASGMASGTAGAQAGLGRTVVSARTFQSLACDGTSCRFELAAEKDQEACSGSFDKVQNTVIVVAAGVPALFRPMGHAGRPAARSKGPGGRSARRFWANHVAQCTAFRSLSSSFGECGEARVSNGHSCSKRPHVLFGGVLDRRHTMPSHERHGRPRRVSRLRGEGTNLPRAVRAGVSLLRRNWNEALKRLTPSLTNRSSRS